jgi:uncharacterized membrane protein YfcA
LLYNFGKLKTSKMSKMRIYLIVVITAMIGILLLAFYIDDKVLEQFFYSVFIIVGLVVTKRLILESRK